VTLQCPDLKESSGLAVSQHDSQLVWTHNDSGSGPLLYLFDRVQGELRGVFELSGTKAIDWEDMCAFESGGKRFLAIGDVGDNQRRRKQVQIHVMEEPIPPPHSLYSNTALSRSAAGKLPSPVILPIRHKLTLEISYPEPAVDCESVAYDHRNSCFLLLTKELFRCRIFRVPLDATTLPSVHSGSLSHTVQCVAEHVQTLGIPLATAADICPESHRLAVCTYGPAYMLSWEEDEWSEQSMLRVKLPKRRQGEAIAFARPDTLLVTSEFSPTPLWTVSITLKSLDR